MKNNKKKENSLIIKIKKLKKKNYLNIISLIIIFILNTFIYFKYAVQLFPDSLLYYNNARIIIGDLSIASWQIVRGFSYPLIIAIWFCLFGHNHFALLMGSFIFYQTFLLIIGRIIQINIDNNGRNNVKIIFILYLLTLYFNPLIIGYSHTLLTEQVIPLFYLLSVILFFKWNNISFKDEKKKYIKISVLIAVLGVIIWFIKQPFAPAYYGTLFVVSFTSGILFKNYKEIVYKLITTCICGFVLVISLITWNGFINNATGKSVTDMNNGYISDGLLGGTNVYFYKLDKEYFCTNDFVSNVEMNNKDKKRLLKLYDSKNESWCDYTTFYELREKDNSYITTEMLISKTKNKSMIEMIIFYLKNLFKHPTYVFRSYFYNYLAISDIQERDFTNGYRSSLQFSEGVLGENLTNGIATFYHAKSNIQTTDDGLSKLFVNTNKESSFITPILMINMSLCFYLYKVLTLIALPLAIYYFIKYVKTKENVYLWILIINIMNFINAMFNVVFGGVIDRYVYPTYTIALLSFVLIFINVEQKKKLKRKTKK